MEAAIKKFLASLHSLSLRCSQNPVVSHLNSLENTLDPICNWLYDTSEKLDNNKDLYFLHQQVSLTLDYTRDAIERYTSTSTQNWHPNQNSSISSQDSYSQTSRAKLFKRDFQTKEDLKIDKLTNMMADLTRRLEKSERKLCKKGGKSSTIDSSVKSSEDDFL